MAHLNRIKLLGVLDRVQTVLRDHLNAEITAVLAELAAEGVAVPDGFAVLEDTTTQVVIGDHFDYEPLVYPSIRITFPEATFSPKASRSVADGQLRLNLGVYIEATHGDDECVDDIIPGLQRTAVAYLETVRACLEARLPGEGVTWTLAERWTRVDAPQDPEDPCKLRQKYELIMVAGARVRQSAGLTT